VIAGPLVIRCLGLAGRLEHTADGRSPVGEYLAAFDPEARDGRGFATFTRELDRALVLPDVRAAWELIGTRPKARPTRPDGKPNRPLTAFTLQIVPRDAAP
jgi:hypothetical protein